MTFHEQAQLLEIQEKSEGVYSWETVKSLWVLGEIQTKNNLFSKIGIGARSVLLSMYQRDISLSQAFRWKGRFCFLSNIQKDGVYLKVSAALVEPVTCRYICKKYRYDERRRPVEDKPKTISFPGILTEKYLGYERDQPKAVNELDYVLVTPKCIGLESGKIVEVGGVPYTIAICHTLDEYKNEYEIRREEDT